MVLLISTRLSSASGGEGLTDSERRGIDQGELIVKTREVEGYPWPEVTVYRRIAASPEEVMAAYADFESQVGYLPNLVESRIVKRVSRTSFHVSYESEVTGPNERYTVQVALSRFPGGLQVTWDPVTARFARRLSGQMKVAAFGSGTLIEYAHRVDPGFFGVRLGSPGTTVRQLRETVHALATYVERLHIEQQEKLRALTHTLASMLGEPE